MILDKSQLMILMVDAAGGTLEGRTALQKWFYFASVKLGLDFGFIPHFYGPYSEAISQTINNLIGSDFLIEKGRVTCNDRVIYAYALTDDGKALAGDLKKEEPEFYEKLEEIVNICKSVAGNNISILSWAAKVYYLLQRKGKQITYEETEKIARSFGWKLSEKEITAGARLLSALEIAKTD